MTDSDLIFAGVVHEHPRIGSDGESEEGSRTSEDVVSPANRGQTEAACTAGGATSVATSSSSGGSAAGGGAGSNINGTTMYGGVKMRPKGSNPRRLTSQEEINKRLSLPADLKLPDNFVEKQAVSPTLEGPLTRATRRQSLSEIGFGRMDTYTKLDKLGEVCVLGRRSRCSKEFFNKSTVQMNSNFEISRYSNILQISKAL